METEKAANIRRSLIRSMDSASQALTDFCKPYRNEMGLVSDEIKQSLRYKTFSDAYQITKNNLQIFMKNHQSKEYAKAFKAETVKYYQQKRGN